jgi:simple sugar transport system ATP-binding protein
VLELQNIQKNYGAVTALGNVSLRLVGSEILALVGDNGAGKSTLAKIIAGAVSPSAGAILVNGERVVFRSPADASSLGIQMVYQDLSLIESLDIASNLYLAHERRRRGVFGRLGLLDKATMRSESGKFFEELGIRVGPVRRPVEVLSGGQRQAVAIARAFVRAREGAGVVILDEPTAALGVGPTRQVIELVKQLHDQGILVVLITHNMPLCFELATRIVVLRHGSLVADMRPNDTNLNQIVAHITGVGVGALLSTPR